MLFGSWLTGNPRAFRCVSSCFSWRFLVHLDEHPHAFRCVVSSGEATLSFIWACRVSARKKFMGGGHQRAEGALLAGGLGGLHLKKCKFSNPSSGRIFPSTAIAIQACRSCSRALDAAAVVTCDIHNAKCTFGDANDLGQRSHCIRSHGLLSSYNFSLIILAES